MGSLLGGLWQRYGLKIVRYCGVSVVNVVVGQSLLVFFHRGLDWPGALANVAAVSLSTIPAYLMSRHWVWGQSGGHDIRREVAPFWALAFIGLVISTIAVAVVDRRTDATIAVQLANLASFGVVWIAKFFILDHIMWADATAELDSAA